MASMIRIAVVLSLAVVAACESAEPVQHLSPGLNDVVGAGIAIIQKVVHRIRTTPASTVTKEVLGLGFKHYAPNIKFEIFDGMPREAVESYLISRLTRLMNFRHPDVIQGVEAAIKTGLSAEPNTWNDVKIAYSQDSSQVQLVDIIMTNRGDGIFNIIACSLGPIKLVSDVKYAQVFKSYIGSTYSETSIEQNQYPTDLTEGDFHVLLGFLHIAAFRTVASAIGMFVPYVPDILVCI